MPNRKINKTPAALAILALGAIAVSAYFINVIDYKVDVPVDQALRIRKENPACFPEVDDDDFACDSHALAMCVRVCAELLKLSNEFNAVVLPEVGVGVGLSVACLAFLVFAAKALSCWTSSDPAAVPLIDPLAAPPGYVLAFWQPPVVPVQGAAAPVVGLKGATAAGPGII